MLRASPAPAVAGSSPLSRRAFRGSWYNSSDLVGVFAGGSNRGCIPTCALLWFDVGGLQDRPPTINLGFLQGHTGHLITSAPAGPFLRHLIRLADLGGKPLLSL